MRLDRFPCHVSLGRGAITESTSMASPGLGENRGPLSGFQVNVRTEYVFQCPVVHIQGPSFLQKATLKNAVL